MFDFLVHDSYYSLFFDANDIIDYNFLHSQNLLKFFTLFQSLALFHFSFKLFLLFFLSLLFLFEQALLSQFKKRFFHFFLELLNFEQTNTPNIFLCILNIIFCFFENKGLIYCSLSLINRSHFNK